MKYGKSDGKSGALGPLTHCEECGLPADECICPNYEDKPVAARDLLRVKKKSPRKIDK
jgi:hypothetical protein